MRGSEERAAGMFSYIRLEDRIAADHPLRAIRALVDEVLAALSGRFAGLYASTGRPSIPPEQLLRATLVQAFFSVRSERQLMEQINYLLFRWFVGLDIDAAAWDASTFSKNRDRLLEADVAREFLTTLMGLGRVRRMLSSDHFSVDGTMIDAWASMKSFRAKDGSDDPPGPGRNGERDFRREKRSNETHVSTTDPDARLFRKADGQASRLCYLGHALMEHRNALIVDATLTHATGTAEREAALAMIERTRKPGRRVTLAGDKLFDAASFVSALRERKVTPHIAVNGTVSKLGKVRKTLIDRRTTRHDGYGTSLRIRKRIEEAFGWAKTIGGMARLKVRGIARARAAFTFRMIAYNLVRLPKIIAATA
jgi:transposase